MADAQPAEPEGAAEPEPPSPRALALAALAAGRSKTRRASLPGCVEDERDGAAPGSNGSGSNDGGGTTQQHPPPRGGQVAPLPPMPQRRRAVALAPTSLPVLPVELPGGGKKSGGGPGFLRRGSQMLNNSMKEFSASKEQKRRRRRLSLQQFVGTQVGNPAVVVLVWSPASCWGSQTAAVRRGCKLDSGGGIGCNQDIEVVEILLPNSKTRMAWELFIALLVRLVRHHPGRISRFHQTHRKSRVFFQLLAQQLFSSYVVAFLIFPMRDGGPGEHWTAPIVGRFAFDGAASHRPHTASHTHTPTFTLRGVSTEPDGKGGRVPFG